MYRSSPVTRWVLGRSRWVLHLLFWLGWAAVVAIFFFDVALGHIQGWAEFAIYLAMHMGVFYVTCYRIAPAIFKRRRHVWWRLPLYPAAMLAGLAVLLTLVSVVLGGLKIDWSPHELPLVLILNFWPVALPFVPSVVTGLLFYGLRWGVMQFVALRQVQEFSAGLSRSLASSRQSELFMRILPHLLLNLMPILHRIVVVNYERFSEAFDRASELLKFFARLPPGERIPAWEELRRVYKLVGLREMATGQKIYIRWELDERLSELTVFPMAIFVPVENALKYAVTTKPGTPVVVRVKREDKMAVVEIENVINRDAVGKEKGLGMGLDNLREQLEILTDADFSLDTLEKDGRFWVMIRFPEPQFEKRK